MIRLMRQPRWVKIVEVEPLYEKGFDVRVTFQLRNSDIIEQRFCLSNPWGAWSFAQLMISCKKATEFQKMKGKRVMVFLVKSEEGVKVIALYDKKRNAVYPCAPYGTFEAKEYAVSQFLREWDIE